MQPQITFVKSPQDLQDFKSDVHLCVTYVEWNHRILTFPNRKENWDLPAGKIQEKENPIDAAVRILNEKAELAAHPQTLSDQGQRYVRGLGSDTVIHFFRLQLAQKPDHLQTASWVSVFAYRYQHMILDNKLFLDARPPEDGRLEAFSAVYDSLIWHPIPNPVAGPAAVIGVRTLVLRKGDEKIEFNPDKRWIISLLGIAASGKKTQGLLLNKVFGLPSTSTREQFAIERKGVQNMVRAYTANFEGQPIPDEVPNGMIAEWMSLPECQAGVVLRGFPATEEQCKPLVNLFRRNTDLLISFYLSMRDDVTARIPEGDRSYAEKRNSMMLTHKDAVVACLQARVLDLEANDSIADVFHLILQHLQVAFEAVHTEDKRREALLLARVVQPVREAGGAGGGGGPVAERAGVPGQPNRGVSGKKGGKVSEQSPLLARAEDADEEEGKCCVVQ